MNHNIEIPKTVPPSPVTVELLEKVIDAWIAQSLSPMFYHLTRTFAHHRKPETYGTTYIFERFRHFAKDEGKLLDQMESFKSMIMNEWAQHPEGRIIKLAEKPPTL